MTCAICRYTYNILVWLDAGLNTLTGGAPLQTVSSRLGHAKLAGKYWAIAFCKVLNWVFRESDHCVAAIRPQDEEGEIIDLDGQGANIPKPPTK